MPRRKPGTALTPAKTYEIEGRVMAGAWRVPERHPETAGPWSVEADKVAWTDAATGYPCIIRRDERGGHLCGYVAVAPDHPLHGFQAELLAPLGIVGHGGINYAKACDPSAPEDSSICHVHDGGRGHRSRDDAWWFGFSADHPSDVQPGRPPSPGDIGLETGLKAEYRDERYMLLHVLDVAAQLHAIAEDRDPPPPLAPAPPPIGANPAGPRIG